MTEQGASRSTPMGKWLRWTIGAVVGVAVGLVGVAIYNSGGTYRCDFAISDTTDQHQWGLTYAAEMCDRGDQRLPLPPLNYGGETPGWEHVGNGWGVLVAAAGFGVLTWLVPIAIGRLQRPPRPTRPAPLQPGGTVWWSEDGAAWRTTASQETVGVVVVHTTLAHGGGETAATGIVLSSSGQVLTNNHVIRGASAIRVTVPSPARTYTATVAGYSVSKDVALLELQNAQGLQTVAIGSSAALEVGDRVTSVGNAGGTGVLSTKSGRVTGLRQSITVGEEGGSSTRLTGLIETSVPLKPGDSGGPLLRSGRVIGMAAAAASVDFRFPESGEGFAIPIATALRIAEQIEAGRRSASVHVGPTAFLGVSLRQPRALEQDTVGATVDTVVPGSPADRAGIGSDDVITSLAGRRISSPTKLRNRIIQLAPGRAARIAWIDILTGRTSATVRLVSGPPQ